MSARLPDLTLLSPAALLAAAERILVQPTCNVQRVSLDETFTFALATTHFFEICTLAAAHVQGTIAAADLARLRQHLVGLGFIAPAFSAPTPKDTV